MSMKYSQEMLAEAAKASISVAGVLRYLNLRQAGGTQARISLLLRNYQIDTSHFLGQGHNKGSRNPKRKTSEQILVVLPENSHRAKPAQLRRALLQIGVPLNCNSCGISETWNSKPLKLEINHIDGDWLNNQPGNLEFLCPNCHSQEKHSNMPHKYRNKV